MKQFDQSLNQIWFNGNHICPKITIQCSSEKTQHNGLLSDFFRIILRLKDKSNERNYSDSGKINMLFINSFGKTMEINQHN